MTTININIKDILGVAKITKVTFRLLAQITTEGVVLAPGTLKFINTDVDGLATIQLFQGNYFVQVDRSFFKISVSGIGTANLVDLIALTPQTPFQRGVPSGGDINQVLGKLSSEDFDLGWVDQSGGGGGGGSTNLTYTASPTQGQVNSNTGTDAVIPATDITNAGLFLSSEKTKLAGVATNATANNSDAFLLDRINHTSTQSISTIINLQSNLDSKQNTLVSNVNIKTLNGNSLLGSGDIVISGGGGSTVWGGISGTLSSQADLQAALDTKQNTITNSDGITEGSSNLFLTSTERTKLANTANANTGDETTGSILTKIGNGSTIDDNYLPNSIARDSEILTKTLDTSFTPTNSPIILGDTVLESLEKAQGQINNKQNTITNSDSITQGSTNLFLTSGERTKLTNTTGTNSGDQNASSIPIDTTNLKVVTDANLQDYAENNDIALLNARNTGYRFGGVATKASATTINHTVGAGELLNNTDAQNPTYTPIIFTAKTGVALANTTVTNTYWYYDDNSDVLKQTIVEPTAGDYRTKFWLFRTAYNGAEITAVTSIKTQVQQTANNLRDLAEAIGVIKISGQQIASSGANLKLLVTSGILYGYGSNSNNSSINPSFSSFASFDSALTDVFRYSTNTTIGTVNLTDIQVANYQVGGVVTAIPGANTRLGMHFVFRFPASQNIRIVYGDAFYSTLADALAALPNINPYAIAPTNYVNALVLGVIIAEKGSTSLTTATFKQTNKLGDFAGGVATGSSGYLQILNNLSDLNNIVTARTNLGLGNVDNTSDANKPISTATQTALNLKVDTTTLSNYETTTQLNTRDTNNRNRSNHTGSQAISTITNLQTDLNAKANIAGQVFTGNIQVPQINTSKQTLTPVGTTQIINWNNGSIVDLVLSSASGNVTLTLQNPVSATSYIIKVTQGATARNVIFPVGTLQAGGGGNTYIGTSNYKDVIALLWDGTNYFISVSKNYS